MKAIGKEDALRLAKRHASAVRLDHPDYRMECEFRGDIAEGWLFTYRIRCTKNIPLQDQEQFAGAAGFLISRQGEAHDLTSPRYVEAEKKLVSE